MEPLPRCELFHVAFPNGAIHEIPIYTRYPIKTEVDVLRYFRINPNARRIIYKPTNEQRLQGRQDMHITHRRLADPIILDYTMDDTGVCTYLTKRIHQYVRRRRAAHNKAGLVTPTQQSVPE